MFADALAVDLIGINKRKLKERFDNVIAVRHLATTTADAYWRRIVEFLLHFRRGDQSTRPEDLGLKDVQDFLTYLATQRKCSESRQSQSFYALRFLCMDVLRMPFEGVDAMLSRWVNGIIPFVLLRTVFGCCELSLAA